MNRVVAAAVALVSVGFVVFDALFLDFFGLFIIIPAALLPLGIVGALLVARVPRNRVGWLLALAGLLLELMLAGSAYGWAALVRDPGSLPHGEIGALFGSTLFAPALGCIVLMLLFFPSGRGLGGRWTWIERAITLLVLAVAVIELFKDVPLEVSLPLSQLNGSPTFIANPLAQQGAAGAVIAAGGFITRTIPIVLVGPLSLFVRYRRSSELERVQIKWLAFAGTIALSLLVASRFVAGGLSDWVWAGGIIALGLLPVAIAIAIFRYRLYDIDVLIERTLVYGATTAAIGVAFFAGIVLLQAALRPLTGGSEIAVAGSTLFCFALFQPIRQRVQSTVDRRFYRARYDAVRTMDRFTTELAGEVELGAVRACLLAAVGETLQPVSASVWLRNDSRTLAN
jgi:hypothetical protein